MRRNPRGRPMPPVQDDLFFGDISEVMIPDPPSTAMESLDPFSFISNSVGMPGFLAALLYPQVKELAKKWPRLWKILTVLVAVQLTYRYTYDKVKNMVTYLLKFCAGSMQIYEGDELYGCFQRWLAAQRPYFTYQSVVTAQSLQHRNMLRPYESEENLRSTPDGIYSGNIDVQRKYRVRMFRYKGQQYLITHNTLDKTCIGKDGRTKAAKGMTIWKLGGNVKPIADILDEAVTTHSNDGEKSSTTLYVPGSTNSAVYDYDGAGLWKKHSVKPCRPLDTVYLDGTERDSIAEDVSRFLHPETALRYRLKGIPHRRGYLFYGPPGNGKSSLAMALAGHFGLNVYSLSLRDTGMSDSYLAQLFNVLPSGKVLVLLEDIDSAGLRREYEFEDDEDSSRISDPRYNDWGVEARMQPRAGRGRSRATNVTLSGVLNALDGVQAPEGHIVVMTTNAPDSLDKALVRPGRIDERIEFKNASPKQMHDIFHRMYRDEKAASSNGSTTPASPSVFPALPPATTIAAEKTVPSTSDPTFYHPRAYKPVLAAELAALATSFSQQIPAGEHSLASVQNYLLGKVDQPHEAVAGAKAWAEEEVKERKEYEKRKAERKLKREVEDARRREMARKQVEALPALPAMSRLGSGAGVEDGIVEV